MTAAKRQTYLSDLSQRLSRQIWSRESDDKIALMGKLMMIEAITHWLWIVFVVIGIEEFQSFIVIKHLIALFSGCTIFIVIMAALTFQTTKVKLNKSLCFRYQAAMLLIYSVYITSLMLLLGQASFFTGVSLVGGVTVGMLLANRELVWRAFLVQCVAVVFFMVLPYWLGELPSLKQDTHTLLFMQDSSNWMVKGSAIPLEGLIQHRALNEPERLFWRMSYLYLGLPKAIMMVYTIKKLLEGIAYRKAKIRYNAEYDELTKIRNRRSLVEFAKKNLCTNKINCDQSYVLIDLDHFKQVNDVYGHLAGDKMLYQVAQLLQAQLPKYAEIGRYGGEEFLVILPNTSLEAAVSIANSLRIKLFERAIDIGEGREITMTASFGVASLHVDCISLISQTYLKGLNNHELKREFNLELNETLKTVLNQADKALYKAKTYGRNRVVTSPVIYFDKLKRIKRH